jgi:hypothetical protein
METSNKYLEIIAIIMFFVYLEKEFLNNKKDINNLSAIFLLTTDDLKGLGTNGIEFLLKTSEVAILENSLFNEYFWYSIGSFNIFIYKKEEILLVKRFIDTGNTSSIYEWNKFIEEEKKK